MTGENADLRDCYETKIQKRTKPDHKLTPAEKRRIINGEIDQEEKATTSSASTGTNGM